jgi:hypothetical protein
MIRHQTNDTYTVAAIALLAMCVVTFDHEALGHGGACLALGGHIRQLTSSIFRCDLHSPWIDPAGPFTNLLAGTLALLLASVVPRQRPAWRLGLVLLACFSYFWEAGYLIKAMATADGDLYFAGLNIFGEPTIAWRLASAGLGLALYLFTARWTVRALLSLWPDKAIARTVARTAWLAATLGALLAASAYDGTGWMALRNALLEIGAASFPLLLIPTAPALSGITLLTPTHISRSRLTISVALLVFALFIATLGRGLRF